MYDAYDDTCAVPKKLHSYTSGNANDPSNGPSATSRQEKSMHETRPQRTRAVTKRQSSNNTPPNCRQWRHPTIPCHYLFRTLYPVAYPQFARDADEQLASAKVELLAIQKYAHNVSAQPSRGVVVRAASKTPRHRGEINRPPHYRRVPFRQLQGKGGKREKREKWPHVLLFGRNADEWDVKWISVCGRPVLSLVLGIDEMFAPCQGHARAFRQASMHLRAAL